MPAFLFLFGFYRAEKTDVRKLQIIFFESIKAKQTGRKACGHSGIYAYPGIGSESLSFICRVKKQSWRMAEYSYYIVKIPCLRRRPRP